jgi:hypothetical protein
MDYPPRKSEDAMNAGHFAATAAFLAAILALPQPTAAQNRVLVEPVKANLDRNWIYEIKESRGKTYAITESDARRIAAEMAASLQKELDRALRAEGFEIASASGSGIVRLAVAIDDLYVNAVESGAAGVKHLTRDAGRATLRAEARDAGGATVYKAEERAQAGDSGARLKYTTDVSNRFWFDAAFRSWSAEVARELKQKRL